MKIVKNGKVYNTETSVEIYYNGKNETMTYRTAKGNYFSIADESEVLETLTEVEVMENYLNYVGIDNFIDNFTADDEVNEVLPKLLEYAENLMEA